MTASDRATAIRRAKKAGFDPAWIRDAHDVRAVLEGCVYDMAAGDHVVAFFARYLRHSKGQWAGEPFALLAWEEDALRRLFGWMRADGTRRYRRGGIWVPKKNGKSTLAAGIELYLLVGDGEPGAEVYTAANDRGQAGIIYNECANMVKKSPDLRKRLQTIDSRKTIAYPAMNATLQALSADVGTKEGINAHGIVHDELHARKNRGMWDTLAYAGASRRQPLALSISTAGTYDPTSIAWEQYQYAKHVLDDTIHDWAFFALIFEASDTDDWTQPATWQKANPSFGETINADTFAQECAEARVEPRKENAFKRYRLNIWVRQATRWIPSDAWAACAGHAGRLELEAFIGRTCDAGLDLGSVSDLSAFVIVAPCEDDPDALDLVARFWVPESALVDDPAADDHNKQKRNPNAALYRQWKSEHWLDTTPGNVTDYDFLEAAIIADAERVQIRSLAIDRLWQGQQLMLHLAAEGLTMFPLGQGFTAQGPPMKELERRWKAGTIHHANHPILTWMAENVEVKADPAGNLKIVKPSPNDPRKVDGMTALVSAIDRVTRYADDDGDSAYTDHDLLIV